MASRFGFSPQAWRSHLQSSRGDNHEGSRLRRDRNRARFGGSPAAAEWFPKGEVFEPLIADPNETRTFLSMLSVDSETVQSWFGDVGVGVNFGLYRWAGKQPGDASQPGPLCRRELALRPGRIVLSPRQHRLPGRVSRTNCSAGSSPARSRLFHQSSHLGDELILQGNAPQRVNLSVEVVDLLLAWQWGGWRPYGGGMYIIHRDPDDLKQGGFQVGLDYTGTERVLFGGRLVGGIDYRSFEENDWRGGMSIKAGLEYGLPALTAAESNCSSSTTTAPRRGASSITTSSRITASACSSISDAGGPPSRRLRPRRDCRKPHRQHLQPLRSHQIWEPEGALAECEGGARRRWRRPPSS